MVKRVSFKHVEPKGSISFERTSSSCKIFFDKHIYRPHLTDIEDTARNLEFYNYCAGININLFTQGIIEIFYNPLRHRPEDRRTTENSLKKVIESSYNSPV